MSNDNKQEIVCNIKDYIANVDSQLENVIEDIRNNNNINDLVDVLDGLAYCFRGLALTKDIHNIDVDESFLQDKIQEILEAIKNEDYTLVADITEYEILDIVRNINENLQNI